jgi:hypothetical protein
VDASATEILSHQSSAPACPLDVPRYEDDRLVNSYGPDCVLTLVDPDDISAFIVAALNNSSKFGGETITVVGQDMRFDDMIENFSETYGHQDTRGDRGRYSQPVFLQDRCRATGGQAREYEGDQDVRHTAQKN